MTQTGLRKSRYRYRVLCVDDNDIGAYVAATILRCEGYEALACSDVLQAAAIAKKEEIDLAVLSYRMPVMNGAELAAFCKAANPDMKVILLSDWLGIPKPELAFVDLFLQKSDDTETLLAGAEALLTRSRLQALHDFGSDHQIRAEN